jgi:hypothetical protein
MAAAVLFLCLTVVAAAGQRGYERRAPLRQFRYAQLQSRPNRAQNQRQNRNQQRQYQAQQRPNQNQQRPYQPQQRPNQNQQRPYQPQQQPNQNQQRPYQTQQQPNQNQPRPYQTQQRPFQPIPQYNGGQRPTTAYPAPGDRPGTPAPNYTRPAYPNGNGSGNAFIPARRLPGI